MISRRTANALGEAYADRFTYLRTVYSGRSSEKKSTVNKEGVESRYVVPAVLSESLTKSYRPNYGHTQVVARLCG